MSLVEETVDVVVVGAGHAGCEAALACARLGLETVIFTMSVEAIAMMPCNPHIGGSSKGHLVREIDALGGQMAVNADKTFIQSKMLNQSKGPAVHSLRVQADKAAYSALMRQTLEQQEGLTIRQMEVTEILTDDSGSLCGVKTYSDAVYHCKAAILCTGTYLNARCIFGEVSMHTGPNGTPAANHLTESLKEDVQIEQVPCWLTYTNEETHDIIRQNLDRSPIYAGIIEGTGPRYCPSFEDKAVRFADKERHQVFVEPEGLGTNEMYIGGMSSSMPEDVQIRMYHTVPGLEKAKIVKNAYAIEYDCIISQQLKNTLEFKKIPGLYSGGQFNGSSGYEEAAAQGLYAGINAALKILGKEPLLIDRSEGYIGVLVDDLITKENHEPYRMMTSRAEYRLLLRQDNADMRLLEKGYRAGLISEERYQRFLQKKKQIRDEIDRVEHTNIGANENTQQFLTKNGSSPLSTSASLAELVRRPELDYEMLKEIDIGRPELPKDVRDEVNIEIKYDGYIRRQEKQVAQFKKIEEKRIPEEIDYDKIPSLRNEARQKLKEVRPSSIGQASRVMGVNPADLSVLMVYLKL